MSDVPEGYKMSEVGVIPGEWEVKSLENIGLFKKGKNIPKKDLTSEGVPCVLYGEIYTKYNFTSKKLRSFIPLAIAQQSTSINKGDILFAGSGETVDEIGKCFTYLGDEKACAGGDINILSPFNDDSTFLGYLLNSPQVNKQKSNLAQGSSVVHIYSSSLKTILIPLPPLPEQQAIASALSDVDVLITALEQLITKKRNIKQGAMQQLLTGEKRLPGFGGGWEVKNLGEIAEIQRGASPRPIDSPIWYDTKSKVGWVRISDVTTSNGKNLSKTKDYLSEKGISQSRFLPKNSLIMSICATVGVPVITSIETCIHDGFIGFSKLNIIDKEFLYYKLKELENSFKSMGQTGSQNNLNLTFKDVVKNTINQPNQCMTYQNINSLAIDLPTSP